MMRCISKVKMWVLLLLLPVAVIQPAKAAVCPPFAETIVLVTNAAAKVSIEMLFNSLFDQISGQIFNFGRRKVTALKTLTSQVATATKAQINAEVSLAQGEMAAIGHLEKMKQQMKVYQEYSPLTGQGVDPCGQMTTQTNVTLATGQVSAQAAEAISHVAAAPGRYGNLESYNDLLLRQRRTLFGTEDEGKLGYGIATKAEVITATGDRFALAGADSNARVLFAESADPLVKTARDAFLNRIAGAPDQPITRDSAGLSAGKEYLAMKARKDAAMSAGLNSLAIVGAEHTPNAELGGKTKVQAMRDLVGLYYGKEAESRWRGWTNQDPRGLMVDHVKMSAAQLAMEADLYQQSQRLEGIVGSMLAVESAREAGPALAAAAQSVESQRARSSVR